MIQLIPKILSYQMFRRFGFPRLLPLNLTVSVSYRCNSKCKTCNVYKRKVEEFTFEEFDKVFQSIGTAPYWVTISGGEPFLRKDIVGICKSVYLRLRPKIINIPTNGILSNIIPSRVEKIAANSPDSQIIVNLSLDAIGEEHDEIRNVKNNYVQALKTYNALKNLNCDNLTVGIHTVISKFNVHRFKHIYEELSKLNPDSYITEIAEERVELGTIGKNITPSNQDYFAAIDFLSKKIMTHEYKGISQITQAFRMRYYKLVKQILSEKRQILPCYAGFISAHIDPGGEVWACCIKAESMGNLRNVNYDFKKVWYSSEAEKKRKPIKEKQCYCPLANASYTNMLVSYSTMAKVLLDIGSKKAKSYFTGTRG